MKKFVRMTAIFLVITTLFLNISSCQIPDSTESGRFFETEISLPYAEAEDDVMATVYTLVMYDLLEEGFSVFPGYAMLGADDQVYTGLIYTDFTESFPEEDQLIFDCGFVNISFTDTEFSQEELLCWGAVAYSDETTCAFRVAYSTPANFDGQFVYKEIYCAYRWVDPFNIQVSWQGNDSALYDQTLGAVYDYDLKQYVFDPMQDESVFQSISLEQEPDYVTFQREVNRIIEEQNNAGFTVESLYYVYIDSETVQALLSSGQSFEEFFGIRISELNASFGTGTALTFTTDGVRMGDIIDDPYDLADSAQIASLDNYDWDGFWGKLIAGCSIIIVGAILAPVTGGSSFSCALAFIAKSTVVASLASAATTIAITAVTEYMGGADMETSAIHALTSGLDMFANTFWTTALITSVSVNLGLTSVCFPGDTCIVLADGESCPISAICPGMTVLSLDPLTGATVPAVVKRVLCGKTDAWLSLETSLGSVLSTDSHPFWSMTRSAYVPAAGLLPGYDMLLSADGLTPTVLDQTYVPVESPKQTFNLEISGSTHNYFVVLDEDGISALVHNNCKNAQILRKNMIKGQGGPKQIPPKGYRTAAHHIVASDNYFNKDNLESLKILEKYHVSVNDSCNGVFLSIEKGANITYHPTLHTNEYYAKVRSFLSTANSEDEVRKILVKIGKMLLEGRF